MKLYRRSVSTPPSQPVPSRVLSRPVREALAELRIIAAPGEAAWFVAGIPEVGRLTNHGISRACIWTARELESLPWDEESVTLGRCLRAWRVDV